VGRVASASSASTPPNCTSSQGIRLPASGSAAASKASGVSTPSSTRPSRSPTRAAQRQRQQAGKGQRHAGAVQHQGLGPRPGVVGGGAQRGGPEADAQDGLVGLQAQHGLVGA
jgi:hypothetical protein